MRDISFFTTQAGVASLSLKEIPYRETAYITVRSATDFLALVDECVGFCKAAGAEKIMITGHPEAERYPLETAIIQLQADVQSVGKTDAALFPVQEKTLEQWRDIYNRRMADVPLAAYLTRTDAQAMVQKGQAYFVHRNGNLLGIGAIDSSKVLNVISLLPGAGKDVLRALVSTLIDGTVTLEVACANEKALRLYETCGFVRTKELSRWFRLV